MPVAIPSEAKIVRQARFRLVRTMGVFDPLVGSQKFNEFNAGKSDRWVGVYTFAPRRGRDLYKIVTWARSLGRDGEFFAFDSDHRTPFGGVVSGLVVDGAGQEGTSINVRGGPASSTPLVTGDYVQIDTQYFQLREDLDTDGDGKGTLQVMPAVRTAFPDGEAVVTDEPVMIARITSEVPQESGADKFAEISIAFEEKV